MKESEHPTQNLKATGGAAQDIYNPFGYRYTRHEDNYKTLYTSLEALTQPEWNNYVKTTPSLVRKSFLEVHTSTVMRIYKGDCKAYQKLTPIPRETRNERREEIICFNDQTQQKRDHSFMHISGELIFCFLIKVWCTNGVPVKIEIGNSVSFVENHMLSWCSTFHIQLIYRKFYSH